LVNRPGRLCEVLVLVVLEDILAVRDRLQKRDGLHTEVAASREDLAKLILGERFRRRALRAGIPLDAVLDLPDDRIVAKARKLVEPALEILAREVSDIHVDVEADHRITPGFIGDKQPVRQPPSAAPAVPFHSIADKPAKYKGRAGLLQQTVGRGKMPS
jgi:hypothetical protein